MAKKSGRVCGSEMEMGSRPNSLREESEGADQNGGIKLTRFAPDSSASAAAAPETLPPLLKKRMSFSNNGDGGGVSQSSTPKKSSTPSTPRDGDHKYALFRTRSLNPGIEKQLSKLREEEREKAEVNAEGGADAGVSNGGGSDGDPVEAPTARRYFAALRGPELEELHESEDALLPLDKKWPFLLRFPISTFGIALGLGSQAILWKQLAKAPSLHFFRAPPAISAVLWIIAAAALASIAACYILKAVLFFEAVRREFHHPVRANFFFAPWIAAMFLALAAPDSATWLAPRPATWCALMAPVFCLELKIYGQWLSGGERRLSRVANPSTHLSVVGNFVGAILGAAVGWKEGAMFFWAIGLAHYTVVFVTLYQRLPTNEALPQELHPVFFLFVAAPSAASIAWERIAGEFDVVARLVYFIALFLFSSLVVRLNFFRGFKFSIAWWAYTFPMTAISIASIRYSQEVTNPGTQALAVTLSCASSLIVCLLFVSTMCHLFFWRTLFPNDVAIAITRHKKKNRSGSKSSSSSSSSKNAEDDVFSSITSSSAFHMINCFGSKDIPAEDVSICDEV